MNIKKKLYGFLTFYMILEFKVQWFELSQLFNLYDI